MKSRREGHQQTRGRRVTSKRIFHLYRPSKHFILKQSWWMRVRLNHHGAISIKIHSGPHLRSAHPSIPPSLFWDTWLVQQSHVLLVRWKILIALIKGKLITPWRKSSSSAFTLHSGELLTICPFLFIHRPTGRPDPAAAAKTKSRALTGRRIITERHTSIMLFNSHRGVQTSDRTPRLIHYWQGN